MALVCGLQNCQHHWPDGSVHQLVLEPARQRRAPVETVLLDVTSITNIGILAGALWVSASSPDCGKTLTGKQWIVVLIAGLVLGYSSRLAFGCNVGAMFSGISTGSIHGWIWVPLAFAGTIFGLRIRRHFGL